MSLKVMGFHLILPVFLITFHLDKVVPKAVNVSGVWSLPQEGFPYFYRYFPDRINWNDAKDICKKYQGELLTGETEELRDASIGYLKNLDVSSQIWLGLLRNSHEQPFVWLNGITVKGEGHWQETPAISESPICVSMDPTADFRWKSFRCDGPQTASFTCQIKVPEWAKSHCLLDTLKSLNVIYIPEDGIIELISDCGLFGTKRITCKQNMNYDDLARKLSCDELTTKQQTDITTQIITRATRHKREKTTENTTSKSTEIKTDVTFLNSAVYTFPGDRKSPTTQQTTIDTQLDKIKEVELANTIEEEKTEMFIHSTKESEFEEEIEEPPRPPRTRGIPHSASLSFYPHFLNRVLG